MTTNTMTVTSADGTTIAYDTVGTGPAVILIGGAFQYRAFDPRTAEIADRLSDRFTVYHYDRRGRGDSTDTQPYAVGREVEDIAALVESAGGSAYLYGMSSGAALALDAVAAGLDVPKLAVYEPPFLVASGGRAVGSDYLQRLDARLASDDRAGAVELFLTEAVGVPAEFVAGMRSQPVWAGFEAVAPTLAYDARIMDGTVAGDGLPADRWAGVKCPTLIGDGGASPESMRTAADALAALVPHSQRVSFPGQDHGIEPAVIAPVLVDFFAAR